jgi:hypothetical protein
MKKASPQSPHTFFKAKEGDFKLEGRLRDGKQLNKECQKASERGTELTHLFETNKGDLGQKVGYRGPK